MPEFIKGLKLSELFFKEAVQPILSANFPQLQYSAGRLDYGSDVLGFDTPQSRDHHWGPRLMLFLSQSDHDRLAEAIHICLGNALPYQFHGYATNFTDLETDSGVMKIVEEGPVNHYVQTATIEGFFLDYTGLDVTRARSMVDWLLVPWQRFATIAAGQVFHDDTGRLSRLQAGLRWYPHALWLYVLAAQWRHIDQEEPFMARCGDVGDEMGSRDLAARLMRRMAQLCFLMEKRFPPYSKWFGTAFSTLSCAPEMLPIFERIHRSKHWQERERHLSEAYLACGRRHNQLGLTPYVEPQISAFHNRPYQVPHANRFVQALRNSLAEKQVIKLPPHLGCVDQFVENVDLLESIPHCQRLRCMLAES